MCPRRIRPGFFFLFALVIALSLTITGCGGGSSAPTVTLSATVSSIDQGQSVTITATTTNDSSDGVSWTLTGVGTLTSSTTTSVTYNAPGSVGSATTVTITATSIKTATITKTITITIEPSPQITTAAGALASGQVGTANYSATITVTGGVAPLTYSVSSGTLPAGLTLNTSTGAITGTPTVSGPYNFDIEVRDSGSPSITVGPVAYSITIAAAPAIVFSTSGALSNATVGTGYSQPVSASGGAGTLTYALASGSLPGGLSLSAAGLITGSLTTPLPTAPDISTFTVTATDGYHDSNTSGPLTIAAAYPTLSITTSGSLPSGIVGTAYSGTTLQASGGNGTYNNWSVTPGNALSQYGLSINSATGAIGGSPTGVTGSPVTDTFTAGLTDSYGDTATSGTLSLTIYPTLSISTASLPSGVVGTAYSQQLAASGGSGSGYTYSVTSGATTLSSVSLTLSSSGLISGMPTTGETESSAPITIQVKDGAGNTATQTYSLTVYAGLSITNSPTLPNGYLDGTYSVQLNAAGGIGPYINWQVISGASALSSVGLQLNSSTGLISTIGATLTGSETSQQFTVQVEDAGTTNTTQQTFTLTVNGGPQITTTNISSATLDSHYSLQFSGSGGSGNFAWSITTGQSALSAIGITMNSSGLLSGTPTSTTTGISFTVELYDNTTGLSITAPYTFIVNNVAVSACTNSGANASILNGHYAFLLGGFDPSGNHFAEIGQFQANGTSTLSGGQADANGDRNNSLFNSGSVNYTFSAVDSIGNSTSDTRGMFTFTNANTASTGLPSTSTYCFVADTITSGVAYSGRLIETDGSGYTLTGFFQIADSGDFSNSNVAGSYAFGVEGVTGATPARAAAIGQFVLGSSGGVSSGQMDHAFYNSGSTSYTAADVLSSGSSSASMTGTGRGTMTLSDGTTAYSFITYFAGNNKLLLLSTSNTSMPLLVGQAIQQSPTSYTTGNVAGTAVFRATGVDAKNFTPAADDFQIGELTFDGAGNASVIVDENDGGTINNGNGSTNGVPNPTLLSGATYSVTSTGYLTLSGAGNHPPNFYLYGPGSGFGMSGDSSLAFYTAAAQTAPSGGSFTNSILNSTYLTGSYAVGTIPSFSYNSSNGYPGYFNSDFSFNDGQMTGTTNIIAAPGTGSYISVDQNYTNTYELDPSYGASSGRVLVDQAGSLNSIGYAVSPTEFFVLNTQSGSDGFIAQSDQITSTVPSNDGLTITTTAVSSGVQGSSYTYQLAATGGTGGNTWTVLSGTGLSGASTLSLSSTGLITGTPTATETNIPFTVQVEDSSSDVATITLYMTVVATSGSNNISGNVAFYNACGTLPSVPTVTLTLNTVPVQTATTNGSGNYTFSSLPNGTYTITPSISGVESLFTPGSSQVTVNNNNPTANFGITAGYTVSGTVTNNSGTAGHVYIALLNQTCSGNTNPGTSVTVTSTAGGTANYTIQGVQAGSYTIQAFLDTVGQGAANTNDPSYTSGSAITVSTANVSTGTNFALGTASTNTITTAPTINGAFTLNSAVGLSYNAITTGNYVEKATSYVVQWSTDSNFSTITGYKVIPATGAGGTNVWFIGGLANGTTYYLRAYGASPASPISSPGSTSIPNPASSTITATTGAPSGADTVSGTISFPGTATGPLYVGFYNQGTGYFYGEYFASPSSPEAYTVNLPTGSGYAAVGILDQNNDGTVDVGDIQNVNSNKSSGIDITGNLSNENFTLAGGSSLSQISSFLNYDMNGDNSTYTTSYGPSMDIGEQVKLPVGITLISAPDLMVPQDISSCAANIECSQGFQFNQTANDTITAGNNYSFDVTYSDGTSNTVTLTLGTVLGPSALASNLLPYTGTSTITSPTFTWTFPANAADYTYQFQMCCVSNSSVWQIPQENSNISGFTNTQIPGTLTWNVDPTNGSNTVNSSLSGGILSTSTQYTWSIQTQDSSGDQATIQVNYQP